MKLISGAAFILGLAAASLVYLRYKTDFLNHGEQKSVFENNPHNSRQMRELTLDNHLTVLLISDPTFNKSAAAMDVGVGSLQDPPAHLGLAHFLEHMLFMGNEKYPDVDEFNRYLHSFQGYSNAYTSDENTNYHFEVNHQGFAGAVDRFAQFFIAPTFDPHFVGRERNAVHSEHEKNLQSDIWRHRMIARTLYAPTHPSHQFSTGTTTTLKNVTREILQQFHQKHYSANSMKLVLMSPLDLDQLAQIATKEFSAIANHNYVKPSYPSEVFAPHSLPQMVTVKAIKDLKKLSLQFPTPSTDAYWRAKPEMIITHLVGHESQGSLLSWLKQQDLATSLSAWHESTSYNGMFHFDINLTDKGIGATDEIIAQFFTYINLLKEKGLEPYIFDELKTMSEINYTYRDLLEGISVASHFADLMHHYPSLEIEKADTLFFDNDPAAYQKFLATIRPDNLFAMFSRNQGSTDRIEPYYGTSYRSEVLALTGERVKQWQHPVAAAPLALPPHNEFIPKKLALAPAGSNATPRKIIDDTWGNFWYQGDDTFLLPKGYIQLLLISEEANRSPRQKVLAMLYTQVLRESLNEWTYNISLAGLHYGVSWNDRGIQVDFSGYSQNLPALIAALSERMHSLTIDERQFAAIKDSYKRSIANAQFDAAYQQSLYEISFLSNKDAIHRASLFQADKGVDLISGISLDEVKAFAAETLFTRLAIEGAAFGNLAADELATEIKNFKAALSTQVLPPAQRPVNRQIKLPEGKTYIEQLASSTNNQCWTTYFQFGTRSPELNAVLRVGLAHLRTSFFNELRTNQQLGYVVHSALHNSEKSQGMIFVIQSGQYAPGVIAERFSAWQLQVLGELEKLSPEEFSAFTTAVATELREKDKTMGDRHGTLLYEAVTLEGLFNYKEKIAVAVEKLTKQQVVEEFARVFNKDHSAALGVYFFKQNTPLLAVLPHAEQISDPLTFKGMLGSF